MAIQMTCRHCGESMGELKEHPRVFDLLNQELSTEESNHMMKENQQGDLMLQLVCETCEETLTQNPGLFENDNFIH
ncbi:MULTISPECIES: anti-sigma-F factor Fin [Allobacillus]|uniref:Anti-sigma-F factor Fin family protein n=1 Tax=Allobacillus halotolerans TaxID=570278 RepID=A0ABS6GLW3_9BACI|nr:MULTISPECIES: anti-sigma-F factor Fin [Allobacillus]MBU6080129.1 anti-sigma-F factor Fin family protein [Allobacillus halotolerans]TSJ65419.1 anti-sigma-F factor Fin family protein [Allobacillus sp. SKP2-8]